MLACLLLVPCVPNLHAAFVGFEAESGALGSDWTVNDAVNPAYITTTVDAITPDRPGSASRVATYTLNFPEAGTYHLYAHVRVGPSAPEDDSMLVASGFGTKSPTNASDWIVVNQLVSAGFTRSTDIVTAGGGAAGNQVWKWIVLSQPFRVEEGSLAQIYQIGSREDGFDIDKFVFGSADYSFTVSNLDNGTDGTPPLPPAEPTDPLSITNAVGVSVAVGSYGVYQVKYDALAWTFTGDLAQGLANRTVNTGTDGVGSYAEIVFSYSSAVPHMAAIRLYDNSPVAIFSDTTLAAGANDLAFPRWDSYPDMQSHVTFGENSFAEYSFSNLRDDSPWIFFNTNHDAFILSSATNYMVASTVMNGSSISCGINASISQLPAGFSHRSILAAQHGIDRTYATWGDTLMALAGKTPPANDAAVELEKLGYWTDNGATYYYNMNEPAGIENTLLAIKDEYANKGVPLAYLQLDSWWYMKGADSTWTSFDGIYLYEEDPALFPNGLADFQQRIDLPLITHSRWIDPSSPYRNLYTMSADVITDPAYWNDRMSYLKGCGVVTFEQDWLSYRGTPAMSLTNGGDAYLGNMQAAAAANGINLQYCMDQGRTFMQGSLYGNLMTSRVSYDDFNSNRWKAFLYGSKIVHSLGIWPWCDVFMSSETRDLLLSTLSAGPVGPGDALTEVNAANLKQSVRADGIIVKPDVPLVPTEDTYVNDALGLGRPFVATTYSDHTDSRALYVFAFGENAGQLDGSFKPFDFGLTNTSYVYDYFAATGTVVNAGDAFNFTTTMPNDFTGGSYYIAVPEGPSGIALIGDAGKFATRGKKRISELSDDGTVTATVQFAEGEESVTLLGYSPGYPALNISQGSGGIVSFNPPTGLFFVNVAPGGTGSAVVQLAPGGTPPPPPAIPTALAATTMGSSQIDLSWSAGTGASGYNLKRATQNGGPYTLVASLFSTSYSDTGLTSDTTYYYVVAAVNGGGESGNSDETQATTFVGAETADYEAEAATLSGAVVGTDHSGYSGTGFADYRNNSGDYIEWSVEVPSAGLYTVSFRYANGGAGDRPLELKVNGAVVAGNLSFVPTGVWNAWGFTASEQVSLNAGLNTVRITAIGSSGANVDYLRLVEVPPSAPAGLNITGVSSGRIDLEWPESSQAAYYIVKRSTASGAPYETIFSHLASTGFADTNGLSAGIRYYYVASAVNSGGESGNSIETNAVPSAVILPSEYSIARIAVSGGTNVGLMVSNSVAGHDYSIWASDSLTDPDWQPIDGTQAGTGSNLDFNIPIDGRTRCYYKLDVLRQ